ncbi:MAG TPA: hypothetical protein G4O03_04255 [Dehalococcoidia bacterium]|jgi:hypothetical protein|nr:hypothetical protein [Dehalococcoidia bacterium]
MSTSANRFTEYYGKFEKMQSWIVNDLTKATIKAQTNLLVGMRVFNYFEILGGFCPTKGSQMKDRFNFVFEQLLPKPYKAVFDELDRITNKGAYDCLRCGMTHEYLVKTYTLKKTTSSIDFTVCGVNDETGFLLNVLTKDCGLELLELEKGKYHLPVYNPRLIHDLNIAFKALKKKLIDDETGYRDKFVARCKD